MEYVYSVHSSEKILSHAISLYLRKRSHMTNCLNFVFFSFGVSEFLKTFFFFLFLQNIKKKMYGSTEALLADAKWIYHNAYVYNGGKLDVDTFFSAQSFDGILVIHRMQSYHRYRGHWFWYNSDVLLSIFS